MPKLPITTYFVNTFGTTVSSAYTILHFNMCSEWRLPCALSMQHLSNRMHFLRMHHCDLIPEVHQRWVMRSSLARAMPGGGDGRGRAPRQVQEGGPGLLRRAGHLRHRPLAQVGSLSTSHPFEKSFLRLSLRIQTGIVSPNPT